MDWRGLSVPGGGPFENVFVTLCLGDGDRIERCETFHIDEVERALARFEDLYTAREAGG